MNRTKKKPKIGHLTKNPSSQKKKGTLTKKVKGYLMGQKNALFFVLTKLHDRVKNFASKLRVEYIYFWLAQYSRQLQQPCQSLKMDKL